MAIDNKYFVGGLNSDDEDRVIPNGDYRYALNIRNSKSDGDSQGSIENTKGDTIISYTLGVGTFKVVGAYDDKLNNKVYYFVWNNGGNHQILEFNGQTDDIQLILSSNFLNLDKDRLIPESNITIIDGLMYWTDIQPYKINIENARNGVLNVLAESDILAIKKAPSTPPITVFGTDNNVRTNNVRAKLFQFRYKYVYLDKEESAWSPISKVTVPNIDNITTGGVNESKHRPFSYYDTSLNNFIRVSVPIPNTNQVEKIKIAFRETNIGDFYLADQKKVVDITTSSSVYDFDFYNNESYISLDNDGNKGMRLFDNVPLEAKAQSLLDGNRIAYGGITENFDPVSIDIDAIPIYTTSPIETAADFTQTLSTQVAYYNQFSVNPLLFLQPHSSIQANPLAAINVAGNIVWLFRSGPAIGSNVLFLQSPSSSAIIVTDTLQVEMRIGGANITDGSRYTVRIKMKYYDYGAVNNVVDWVYQTQITAVSGDTATTLANKIIANLSSARLDTGVMECFFGNFHVGGWSIGLGSNVPSTDVVLKFNAFSFLKILPPSIVTNVSGFNTFGVGSSSSLLTDSSVSYPFNPPNATNSFRVTRAGALVSVEPEIKMYADWSIITEKSLKNGATHGVGLVYYDFANRSGLTNITAKKLFYVPFPTESDKRGVIPPNTYLSSTDLQLTIRHLPPSWATHYQVVYTGNQTIENIKGSVGYKGFIQFKINDFNSSTGITNAQSCKIDELTQFNDQTPESVDIGYGWTKGDRIRFIMDENGKYLQTYADVEIISFDQATKVLMFKKPNITVASGYTVEIYTPKKQIDDTFYYEVGEVKRVINGYHEGNTQNQDVVNPAILLLTDIGDVYMRYRVKPTERQIEDYSYSDYYVSDSWDMGRVNIVDENIKRTFRPTTIRYSGVYVPETNINGLSRFDDFNFETYDQKYGSINILHPTDKLLLVGQQLKVGAIGINQDVIYGDAGEVVSTSRNENKVLSKSIRYYAGEYGMLPESFAFYGNSKYFVDAKRGAVLRLGGDGITQISEYKMHNYFTDILMLLDNSNKPYTIKGVYDVRFDEYVIHILSEDIDIALAFSEQKNRWTTYYSYSPDFMVSNGVGLLRFKDGQLYKCNSNPNYNNFLGFQHNSSIRFVSNVEPSKIKVFDFLTQDSTDVWEMTEATNQYGQITNLVAEDFEDVEGVYKAALLRDENTPNVTLPLIEGDVMRSHSLDITLQNDNVSFVKLFSVGVGVTLSELTNR